jgi:hypothetical protein
MSNFSQRSLSNGTSEEEWGNLRGTVRYEEDSARGSIYPLLRRLGPASRPGILAKTLRSLNLGTSENSPSTHFGE